MTRYVLNKVSIDGPTSYKTILEWIARDAEKEGMDFIKPNIINSVIQHIFSQRGALGGIPHYVVNSITGFGRWLPDKEGIKLRQQYYIERKKYKTDFSKQLKSAKSSLRYTRKRYFEYLETGTAEIKMTYPIWRIATGRQKVLDRQYRKLNKIRKRFMEKEQNKYKYITIKERKKRRKYKN